jgi:integrator complex subunit 4
MQVKYPDQTTQLLVPCRSDLRGSEGEPGSKQEGFLDYRLRTTVLLSHGVWTEACQVDLSLALDLTASEASLGRRGDDNLCVLDLCKPVTISISPKQVKRGI